MENIPGIYLEDSFIQLKTLPKNAGILQSCGNTLFRIKRDGNLLIILYEIWLIQFCLLFVLFSDYAHNYSIWKPDYFHGMACFFNDLGIDVIVIFINKEVVCGEI